MHGGCWQCDCSGARHPFPGLTPASLPSTMPGMKTPNEPDRPAPLTDEDKLLRAWMDLREQMQELHAQLEYARLMLALDKRRG